MSVLFYSVDIGIEIETLNMFTKECLVNNKNGVGLFDC
jgi:hypothetical protein